MCGECCYSVYQSVWHGWGVLFFSLFSMDGECCCCAFVISLFACFARVRSTTTLYQSVWHKWGVLRVCYFSVYWSVWHGTCVGEYCCYPFVVSVFSLIDMGGECYILSCVFCFQSDWHGWGMLHPVMCFLFSVWLTRMGYTTSCHVFSVFSLIDTDGVYYILSCVFCFQSDWHGWGILHLVMCCFCFSVCLTWVGSTTVMLQTSPAPFHAMGNLQRNSAKSMKQFTMPVELSWMHANQVGVVGKGEGKK